jgi:hypothetical protein
MFVRTHAPHDRVHQARAAVDQHGPGGTIAAHATGHQRGVDFIRRRDNHGVGGGGSLQHIQPVIYINTEDYTKFARKTFAEEKGLIERLGMAAKN